MYVCLSDNLIEKQACRRQALQNSSKATHCYFIYVSTYVKLHEASQMQSKGQIYICM